MTDYREIAMQWVTEPHRAEVEAIAKHLHANESLHLHDCTEGTEPCSYCWLRAAKAVQAIERAGRVITQPASVDPQRVNRALRAVIAELDYDLHKAIESDEETGQDTYHETVADFIRAYEAEAGEGE